MTKRQFVYFDPVCGTHVDNSERENWWFESYSGETFDIFRPIINVFSQSSQGNTVNQKHIRECGFTIILTRSYVIWQTLHPKTLNNPPPPSPNQNQV